MTWLARNHTDRNQHDNVQTLDLLNPAVRRRKSSNSKYPRLVTAALKLILDTITPH